MDTKLGQIKVPKGYYRNGKLLGDVHWWKKSKNVMETGDRRVFNTAAGLIVQTWQGNKWVRQVVNNKTKPNAIPTDLRVHVSRDQTVGRLNTRGTAWMGTPKKSVLTISPDGKWVSKNQLIDALKIGSNEDTGEGTGEGETLEPNEITTYFSPEQGRYIATPRSKVSDYMNNVDTTYESVLAQDLQINNKINNKNKVEKPGPSLEVSQLQKDWIDNTRNSPAANAGFEGKERWKLHIADQKWRKETGRKYNKALDSLLIDK